jgi:hypothetical protein
MQIAFRPTSLHHPRLLNSGLGDVAEREIGASKPSENRGRTIFDVFEPHALLRVVWINESKGYIMSLKTVLLAAGLVSATGTAASAVTQDVLDAIVSDLSGQGFTKLEIKNFADTVIIEAVGPDGKLERVYNAEGGVVREETRSTGTHSGSGDDNGQSGEDHGQDDEDHGQDDDDHGKSGDDHGKSDDDHGKSDDDHGNNHDDDDDDHDDNEDDDD